MAGTNILAASSAAPKIFYSNELNDTADHAVYTAPSTGSAIVKHGTITNQNAAGGASVNVSVAVIPSGGVNDGTHNVITSYALAANDTLSLRDYLVGATLGPSESIHVQVGTANVIVVVISGVEFS